MNMEKKTWQVLMILARFPSTFLCLNCRNLKLQTAAVGRLSGQSLSMTQGKAMDKGCLLDLSMASAEVSGCPRAIFTSLSGGWHCGSVWGHAGPTWSTGGCLLSELTSPPRLELNQGLSAPTKGVTQQLPTAGQMTAMPQGSEGLSTCTRSTVLPL